MIFESCFFIYLLPVMLRRRFVELMAAYAAVPLLRDEQSHSLVTRAIPSTGERVPHAGVGCLTLTCAGGWPHISTGPESTAISQTK